MKGPTSHVTALLHRGMRMIKGRITYAMPACILLLHLSAAASAVSGQQSGRIKGDTASVLTTSADGAFSLASSGAALTAGALPGSAVLRLDASRRYQSIDGFGFALTYSSCYNLMHMTPGARRAFLLKTYSPKSGYNVSCARISIGCSDFSSREYSLCDRRGPDGDLLRYFALQSDERDYVIPVIKEILSINPQLRIIASPWTCPKWMKVKDLTHLRPLDSWTDGHLAPQYYEAYALYFVRFVKAMQKEGITVSAVTPQNEPLNRGNCASLYMSWDEEAAFVKVLANAFHTSGLRTKIYVFDHNYSYDGIASEQDYPLKIYGALGGDFPGADLVAGAAYHDYSGDISELSDIHAKAPEKELIFSETSIGTWNDGRNLSRRLTDDMRRVVLGTVNRSCRAVLVWNLMLDSMRGPNLSGGCQTCYGAVDISGDYTRISPNSHYYIIAHASHAAEPGAHRIAESFPEQVTGISCAAFLNPDSTFGLLLLNEGGENRSVSVCDGRRNFSLTVPARSVISCRWKRR